VIDCGTSHPLWTQETERRLKEKDITFLDAPISGMVAKAEAGTLTIMVRLHPNGASIKSLILLGVLVFSKMTTRSGEIREHSMKLSQS